MFEMADKLAGRSKDSNEAIAVAGEIVMSGGVLLGIGDEERAADVLYVKGREASREPFVFEGFFAEAHALEVRVVDLDFRGAEIREVEEAVPVDLGGSHAFIDRAVRGAFVGGVHFEDGIGGAGRRINDWIPAGDGAVFRSKDEDGLLAWGEQKVRRASVENYTRRSRLSARCETGRRNGDDQRAAVLFWRQSVSCAAVQRGGAGVIVRHPPRGRW